MIGELVARQRALAWFGLLCLTASLVTASLQIIDPRLFNTAPVWAKPTKFFLSIGVFALTAAWYYGYVVPEWRDRALLKISAWVLIATGSFETLYIAFRAARAEASHYNGDSLAGAVLYALMGLGAVLLVGTVLPLAWSIWRRPAAGLDPFYRRAVITGLMLTFALGGVLGAYMSAQPGHSVGAEGGHFPLFGWNRLGGDLRIAHFLGIHAEQILPLFAWIVARRLPGGRAVAFWTFTLVFCAATLAVFVQAVDGLPFL